MLETLLNELLDQDLIEVNETGEIVVKNDVNIYAVKDLGFDRIDRERVNGVGFYQDGDALYLHLAQHTTPMSEDVLYDPGVGLR